MVILRIFFATLLIVAKKCCKDFEKPGKCCNVNVARILALFKMLQNACCKEFENSCNINFSNVAKKKTYASYPAGCEVKWSEVKGSEWSEWSVWSEVNQNGP